MFILKFIVFNFLMHKTETFCLFSFPSMLTFPFLQFSRIELCAIQRSVLWMVYRCEEDSNHFFQQGNSVRDWLGQLEHPTFCWQNVLSCYFSFIWNIMIFCLCIDVKKIRNTSLKSYLYLQFLFPHGYIE